MFKVTFLPSGWDSTATPDPIVEFIRTTDWVQVLRLFHKFHPYCRLLKIERVEDH